MLPFFAEFIIAERISYALCNKEIMGVGVGTGCQSHLFFLILE